MLNGPILALDSDQGINAIVTYQLLEASLDFFVIDNRTGGVAQQVPVPSQGHQSAVGSVTSLFPFSRCHFGEAWQRDRPRGFARPLPGVHVGGS